MNVPPRKSWLENKSILKTYSQSSMALLDQLMKMRMLCQKLHQKLSQHQQS